MRKIAIIACDNGLGHVRRCYIIGLELASLGVEVDLFSPKSSFEKFKLLFGTNFLLKNIDFSTGTSSQNLRSSEPFTLNWYKRLPDISIYDKIVSDNLPEILYVRPDAILSGHFFWHEDLDSISEEYKQTCQKLIEDFNPVIIATDLFASEKIRACSNFMPVGLYIYGKSYLDAIGGDALLITGGATASLKAELQKLVQFFIQNGPGLFKKIYVDSTLIIQKNIVSDVDRLPEWIEIATYDVAMFKRVSLAICRSGIGTITDLLQHGGRAYCVYESGNKEIEENAKRIEERGLGKCIGNPRLIEKLELSPSILDDKESANFQRSINSLRFDGAKEAVKIILDNLV